MAGTIVQVAYRTGGQASDIDMLELLATADAADGSFPALDLSSFGVWGTLLALQTNPGSTAPTDNYDITLVDSDGSDRLDSVGLNRDTSTTERVPITGAPWVARGEVLTLTIVSNSVNSATIGIKLWFTRLANTAPGFAQALSSAVDSIALGASTTGGTTPYRNVDLDETAVAVKASAGTLYGIYVVNRTTSVRYVHFYDTAQGSVSVGTTTPVLTFEIPANATDHVGVSPAFPSAGVAFATAITAAATNALTGAGTALGANDLAVDFFYK